MTKIEVISTDELVKLVENPQHTIIDIRSIAAYNGWQLKDESRGGHIPGAKNIPLQWTTYMDWVEVLDEKNINQDEPIILYGYDEEENLQMAEKLSDLGYKKISLYNNFVNEWIANSNLPLNKLAKFSQLVHPEWLYQLIGGESPQHYINDDFVICHAHYDHIEDYHKGHIPDAIPLDTNSLESTETWNRRSPEKLEKTFCDLGISSETTVILYGRYSVPVFNDEKFPGKSAGHLGALRCAAIMLYAGVRDVRILNGGITSWETAGYEVSQSLNKPKPIDDFGAEIPVHPEFMIDTPKVKELLASEDGELVSIRSWEEFIGNQSGYHYIEKRGRIPGAVFGNCGSDAYHMENYRNFDHTMREYEEIVDKWKENGITPNKKIAFYCGTGWRGSEAFINAYLMGWKNISVYDGGWMEWCSDENNPVESGVPEVELKIEDSRSKIS